MTARFTLITLALTAGISLSTAALAGGYGYGYPGPGHYGPMMPGYGVGPMPPRPQAPMMYGYGQPAYGYGQPAYGRPYGQPAPAAAPSSADASESRDQVSISGMQFSPATLTINAGDSVTWQHQDRMPHTVVGEGFASATMNGGNTFTHTFDQPGEYAYQCSLHPGMQGKVVVL